MTEFVWRAAAADVRKLAAGAGVSEETLAAIDYAKKLYATFIPGTESWLDINNNRAFLAGEISLTANGVSLYYAAMKDPAMKALADVLPKLTQAGASIEFYGAISVTSVPETFVVTPVAIKVLDGGAK